MSVALPAPRRHLVGRPPSSARSRLALAVTAPQHHPIGAEGPRPRPPTISLADRVAGGRPWRQHNSRPALPRALENESGGLRDRNAAITGSMSAGFRDRSAANSLGLGASAEGPISSDPAPGASPSHHGTPNPSLGSGRPLPPGPTPLCRRLSSTTLSEPAASGPGLAPEFVGTPPRRVALPQQPAAPVDSSTSSSKGAASCALGATTQVGVDQPRPRPRIAPPHAKQHREQIAISVGRSPSRAARTPERPSRRVRVNRPISALCAEPSVLHQPLTRWPPEGVNTPSRLRG